MMINVSAVTGKVLDGSRCFPFVGTNFVVVWKYRGTRGKMLKHQSRGQDLTFGDEAGMLNIDLCCSVCAVYLIHCRKYRMEHSSFRDVGQHVLLDSTVTVTLR